MSEKAYKKLWEKACKRIVAQDKQIAKLENDIKRLRLALELTRKG